jgi:hypothetical protein
VLAVAGEAGNRTLFDSFGMRRRYDERHGNDGQYSTHAPILILVTAWCVSDEAIQTVAMALDCFP